MSISSQTRRGVLSAAIALLVGLGIGFVGATLGYRYGVLPIPGERPFQRMARVLELTPSQREQIRAVMHETRSKIQAARDKFEQQRHEIFFSAYLQIRALLTPSQQKIFDARFVPPSIRAQAEARRPQESAAAPSAAPVQH